MHILVVIPVHNRPALIQQALDSVSLQTCRPHSVIVVDDGSTDNTPAAIHAWMDRHPDFPIQLIRTQNKGASAARNLGVTSASGEIEAVAFLDSDDLWPVDFLERGSDALSSRTDAVAASTDREFVWVDESRRTHASLETLPHNPWLWMIVHDAGIGSCSLFRLSAFRAAGGYPEEIPTGHDTVLFGRIAAQGNWLHLPGNATIFQRSSSGNSRTHSGHLHQRYPDYLYWWAEASDQLWREAPPDKNMDPLGKKNLALRWSKAARQALKANKPVQARLYLAKAITLCPWSLKYRQKWLASFFKRYPNAT
ncbi:glycosyltransferase family 2 protein [Azonexus sp.]|uniref:glycosyltransferase family 2 protein n=1 Tax=Azonexus sp. TaxID=1872668 RepID=UPI0035B14C82